LKSQTRCDGEDENKNIEKFGRVPDPIKKWDVFENKRIEGIVTA
jgi:hypothetical protein